jgi:predicted O-methyltransferase YrrM
MKELLKRIIRSTPIYFPLRNWLSKRWQLKELEKWDNKTRPVPPPHVIKQRVLSGYAEVYNLRILVETGTFFGDMVEAMKDLFDRIYSIELSQLYFQNAKKRFRSANHIEILQGDSGKVLGDIMKKIDRPALFWLDGHYSVGFTAKGDKETPIFEELHHILNAQDLGHVIIIDDARAFGMGGDYPSIEELQEFIFSRRKNVKITVRDDSIRITPL